MNNFGRYIYLKRPIIFFLEIHLMFLNLSSLDNILVTNRETFEEDVFNVSNAIMTEQLTIRVGF